MKYLIAFAVIAAVLFFVLRKPDSAPVVAEPPIGSHLKGSIDRTKDVKEQVGKRNGTGEY